MPDNGPICVMIPVHKPVLTVDEQLSLRACKTRLAKYDCYLVYPAGMSINAYTAFFAELIPQPVDASWLSSVQKYNKMKLDLRFYQMFAAYSYMVTYELDAYIFNSDLEGSNALTFDFIGAPFFEGYWAAGPQSEFMDGCNSGFSIRNIPACIRVLEGMKKFKLHWLLYTLFLSRITILRVKLNELTNKKYEVFVTGRFGFYFDDSHVNEDVVWSEIVPKLFPSFAIADPLSALKFSFEYNLEKSLALNNNQLPIGCHAWYKHIDFWKTYIDLKS